MLVGCFSGMWDLVAIVPERESVCSREVMNVVLVDVCGLRKERGFVMRFGMRFVSMNKWMGSCWNLKSVGSLHSFMLLWSSCALSERGFILILFQSA